MESWFSTGTNTFNFSAANESDPGSIEPKWHSTGAINGHPYVSAGSLGFGTPGFADGSGDPNSWTDHFLLDLATPVTGDAVLILSSDGPSFRYYLDRSGQMGFENNGVFYDIAAATSGLQVITFWLNGATQELKLYRNGVQVGSTNTNVPVDGFTRPGPLYFLHSGAGGDVPTGSKILAYWGYKEAQSAPDLADQVAYLMDKAGL